MVFDVDVAESEIKRGAEIVKQERELRESGHVPSNPLVNDKCVNGGFDSEQFFFSFLFFLI
jgi:hypothetical protein